MSKKGEYETGKSKALRVAIIGCFAVFTVFAMIASLLFGSADISFGVILHTLMGMSRRQMKWSSGISDSREIS